MTEYAGLGDARRSMELLWGIEPSVARAARGPKKGLDVVTIVAAGIALADAEGLAALSMRKVAERLGRSAMSIYTYVPGKSELLDLMLDHVLGELSRDHPLDLGWRSALEASSRDGWEFYVRHPWVLQIAGSRSTLGPHEFDLYESQLRLVDGLGLTGLEMTRIVAAVAGYVRGAAKAVADARSAEQATGLSDEQWWNSRSPLLEEMATNQAWAERFPLITRLGTEQAFDQLDRPDDTTPYTVRDQLDTFEFGLQRMLDGVAAYIDARQSPA